MTAAPSILANRHWSEAARWAFCLALALLLHGAGALAMLANWNPDSDQIATAPVIMVDLSPVAVAPETTPNELPPGPQQMQTEPEPQPVKPVQEVELKPEPAPEPELAITPPTKPEEKPMEDAPRKKQRVEHSTAPSAVEKRAARAAAPAPGARSRDSNALPNWKSLLVARLERYKRYPSEAQSRGERGVATLAFTVDRGGGVHGARIVRSSGSATLDRETLALVQRAQPLPPPPEGIGGSRIAIIVPIRYSIR